MLGPKVASHVTRAASTTLHGSQSTFRNVWHSNNSSLGWNDRFFDSNGYNQRNSRSSSTFSHSGRAVTQANPGTQSSIDIDDRELYEPRPSPNGSGSAGPAVPPSPLRARSRTTTQSPKELSVSKVLQKRCNHAFASSSTLSDQDPVVPVAPLPPSVEQTSSSAAVLNSDPAAPQTVSPPTPSLDAPSDAFLRLVAPSTLESSLTAAEEVRRFLKNSQNPTVAEFNAALEALVSTRQPGEPLNLILQTYNAMLAQSLYPTVQTYVTLIHALLDRDYEISRLITSHSTRLQRHKLAQVQSDKVRVTQEKIDALKRESNFPSAFSLFQAVLSIGGAAGIPPKVYEKFMRSCAQHNDADALTQIYAEFEARNLKPPPMMFRYMIQTLATARRLEGVEEIFAQFQKATHLRTFYVPDGPSLDQEARFAIMQVYNQTIEAYFRLGSPEKAIELLGSMMASKAPANHGIDEMPPPSSSTYTCVIAGFAQSGDVRSAEKWFARLLDQTTSPEHPLAACEQVPRPDHVAWSVILDALALESDKSNTFSASEIREMAQKDSLFSLPWASEKFLEYTKTMFHPTFQDKETIPAKLMDLLMYHRVLTKYLEVHRAIVTAQTSLPSNWNEHVALAMSAISRLTNSFAWWSQSQTIDASSAAFEATQLAMDTALSFAQKTAELSSTPSPIPAQLSAFALEQLSVYIKAMNTRLTITTGQEAVDPEMKAVFQKRVVQLVSQVVSKHSSDLHPASLIRVISLLRSADVHEPTLELFTGSAVLQRYEEHRREAQMTHGDLYSHPGFQFVRRFTSDEWFTLLTAALARSTNVFKRQAAAQNVDSVPASPSVASEVDTESVSSEPSLSSFGGSDATEETAPDVANYNSPYSSIICILQDMATLGNTSLELLPLQTRRSVVDGVIRAHAGDLESARQFFVTLGHDSALYEETELGRVKLSQASQAEEVVPSQSSSIAPTETAPVAEVPVADSPAFHVPERLYIDPRQTTMTLLDLVDKAQPSQMVAVADKAYKVFFEALGRGLCPVPETVAKMLEVLGRAGTPDKARTAYTYAQEILQKPLKNNLERQTIAWYQFENAMIIALAHADDVEGAHVHRLRILEQGMTPNADAYAALVLKVKDTTDDTSNAMSLFSEAIARGVRGNIFLYNNIISKLSKARKADLAVELFEQMRNNGLNPSSVTYGAVIGACVRVGDAQSAEVLFEEMTRARSFKPRVPPYNMMMQLYTTIVPNRERALHYFEEMKRVGIAPTEHTYKLLMDAYGCCPPPDAAGLDRIFQELLAASQQRNGPKVLGSHFNAMITAYGVCMQNLEKAREVFSIAPQVLGRRDAVIYEAMFDALRTHGRFDEIENYIQMMNAEGQHMTAYICNVLISAYSDAGLVSKAQELFESMQDPPTGVAATGNHAPHDPTAVTTTHPMEPVYREPSTWECMIIAQSRAGNVTAAHNLLARMEERQYPPQVYFKLRSLLSQFGQPASVPATEPAPVNQ